MRSFAHLTVGKGMHQLNEDTVLHLNRDNKLGCPNSRSHLHAGCLWQNWQKVLSHVLIDMQAAAVGGAGNEALH